MSEEIEKIQIRPFVSEPVYVQSQVRITKNLGDYNSIQVGVSISHPCYPEEMGRFYQELVPYVLSMIQKHPLVKKYAGVENAEETED